MIHLNFSNKTMSSTADEELKRAFTELQCKMIDTNQKLKLADLQIDNLKRIKQRSELTVREVDSLPQETRTFESVGRMFLLQDMDTIKRDLCKKTAKAEDKIKSIESNKAYLQKSIKEAENNLREMVQRRQNQ